MTADPAWPSLLGDDEPPPFAVLNPDATRPVLLLCDHASARLPRAVGDLGMAPQVLASHLGWDIGAADVTRLLADRLQLTAVLSGYSRLVIDVNRDLASPEVFLEYSDGQTIFGNQNLSAGARETRAQALHHPYHAQIARQLQRLAAAGVTPVVVSVHSFTPVMSGQPRPWEVGVLWSADPATARVFMDSLAAAGYVVGDNEPYSGHAHQNYTLSRHARGPGLPHVLLEIRQDLIDQAEGVARIGASLQDIIAQHYIRAPLL